MRGSGASRQRWNCGTTYGEDSCNREKPGNAEGNSFSLSRDCVGGGQHAADTAAAREPCMDGTHVVGKKLRPKVYYPCYATLAMREKGSLLRELARAAGARLRELPSAAAPQDKATNLVVRNFPRPRGSSSARRTGSFPQQKVSRQRRSQLLQP